MMHLRENVCPPVFVAGALLLPFLLFPVAARAQIYSEWARPGAANRVVYKERADANLGDRLPDFSMVGYGAGLRPIPTSVPAVVTINPIAGDNTAHIQAAINQAAALPLQPNGFRGAVLLGPGIFNVNGQININASGVVLRGSGFGDNTASATHLVSQNRVGALDNADPVVRFAGSTSGRAYGATLQIADQRVPVGATSFNLTSTAGLSVGRMVEITRPSTQAWVDAMGMTPYWNATERTLTAQRTITRIEGNRVFLDSPITTAIDKQWSTGTLRTYDLPNQIRNVGIENIRGQSLDAREEANESRSWSFVEFSRVADGFMRDAQARHFPYAAVYAKKDDGTQFITVERVASLLPSGEVTGGRRYPFAADAQMTLVRNVTSDNGRHDFVTGSNVNGPIVFFDSVATNARSDTGPHHRWGNGILFDNITTSNEINLRNRGSSGTGHGWAGANSIVWNSEARRFAVQSPPTAQNWLIGSGPHFNDSFAGGPQPAGIYESEAQRVSMGNPTANPLDSLYIAQLIERQQYYVDQRFWTGAAGNTNWSTTSPAGWTNWSNKLAYNTNIAALNARTDVIFNVKGSTALTTTPGQNTTVASLQFDAPTAPVTVQLNNTNNVLTVGSRGVTVFAENHTLTGTAGGSGAAPDLILAGPQTWEIRGNSKLTVNARLRESTGTPLWQKTGTGTLELLASSGGTNSFKAAIVVSQGVLRTSNSGALGHSGNAVTVEDGAAWELNNAGTIAQNNTRITLAGAGINNAGALRHLTGTSRIPAGTGDVFLASAQTYIAADAGFLQIDQPITGTGGLTTIGTANLTFAGTTANTYQGTTRVNAGTLDLAKANAAPAIPGDLIINAATARLLAPHQIADTASVALAHTASLLDLSGHSETVAALSINAGLVRTGVSAVASSTVKVSSLQLTGTGKLDLANNRLIIDYTGASPLDSVRTAIARAHANGTWTGPGLTSTTAHPAGLTLAYAEAAYLLGPAGGTFHGEQLDADALIVLSTRPGDATLDGAVDFADLVNLAQHYNQPTGGTWFTGDFDYDADIDFADLVALAQNYGATPATFAADLAHAFATVPEPHTLTCLALAPLLLHRPRRRQFSPG